MSQPELIDGEIFTDERGSVSALNSFVLGEQKRLYVIDQNPNITRNWNGHKDEKKWFFCLSGKAKIGLVKVDNWQNPSKNLQVFCYLLSGKKSQILCVPKGYANCIKTEGEHATILVLSEKTITEALSEQIKYPPQTWTI